MKQDDPAADDDRTGETLADRFLPDLPRTAGGPGVRQRRSAVDAVSLGPENLRPVGAAAARGDDDASNQKPSQQPFHWCRRYHGIYCRHAQESGRRSSAALAILAAGLYRFGGIRVSRDGSGMWLRSVLERAELTRRSRPTAPGSASGECRNRSRTEALSQPSAAPEAAQPARTETASASEGPARSSNSGRPPGYWPDFRGPDRDGRYDETPIRTDWPGEGLPLLWKQPIGLGYASFVVAGRPRVHDRAAPPAGSRVGVRRRNGPRAVDRTAGTASSSSAWAATARAPRRPITTAGSTRSVRSASSAASTRHSAPWSGAATFSRTTSASNLDWGMAAAPLIVDDTVIVLPGGPRGKSVVAYDKVTGAPVWTALDDQQAYTSPMLVTLGGVRQILVVSATRAMGLDRRPGAVCSGSIHG